MALFEQFPYTDFHHLNLDWVLSYVKSVKERMEELERLNQWEALESEINEVNDQLEIIKTQLQAVKEGAYIENYITALQEWIDEHLKTVVSRVVKFVSFEIDDSGRFIANIPLTWKFLSFDTIMDTENEKFGHLTLTW